MFSPCFVVITHSEHFQCWWRHEYNFIYLTSWQYNAKSRQVAKWPWKRGDFVEAGGGVL